MFGLSHRLSLSFSGSRRAVCLAAALLALGTSGCSGLGSILGAEKTPPDEFRVVSRAPLSVPPNFGLVAPQPGAPRPQETNVRDAARQIVVDRAGGPVGPQNPLLAGRDPDEAALLRLAGTERANPDIRQLVNRESAMIAQAETSFVDRLVFWQEREPPGQVVDPAREAQRLRENTALGRAPTAGETPSIRRRGSSLDRGLLQGLF